MTEKKRLDSQKFAKENNYPHYERVLLPKSKGFITCINSLQGVIDSVYDVTLAYSGWKSFPGPFDMLFLDPKKKYSLHLHVKRIPLKDLPKDPEGLKQWLLESFKGKDKLLEIFEREGHFPAAKSPVKKVDPKEFIFPFSFWGGILVCSLGICYVAFKWLGIF